MDQLTLPFPDDVSTAYRVHVYRNDEHLFAMNKHTFDDAQILRRMFVWALKQSPRSLIKWDDDSRGSGWYGIGPGKPGGADVYHIRIEEDRTN